MRINGPACGLLIVPRFARTREGSKTAPRPRWMISRGTSTDSAQRKWNPLIKEIWQRSEIWPRLHIYYVLLGLAVSHPPGPVCGPLFCRCMAGTGNATAFCLPPYRCPRCCSVDRLSGCMLRLSLLIRTASSSKKSTLLLASCAFAPLAETAFVFPADLARLGHESVLHSQSFELFFFFDHCLSSNGDDAAGLLHQFSCPVQFRVRVQILQSQK
ncbi:hypothetical protein GGS23DRAFT_353945 [Durotheca rogersii]|uniref:uncharacterized protein n=1 Tax=Durotheca rogersii TaxID=419775 RepID=UPI00221F306F|nr:uncharacterized protein GGS23DRAFT_353945 [Durotheca rogersii]KAI5865762.1 hypothetical protein GGS23DRAFT_353945 [Durotheca rogersii]